jgi:hypothetical protein
MEQQGGVSLPVSDGSLSPVEEIQRGSSSDGENGQDQQKLIDMRRGSLPSPIEYQNHGIPELVRADLYVLCNLLRFPLVQNKTLTETEINFTLKEFTHLSQLFNELDTLHGPNCPQNPIHAVVYSMPCGLWLRRCRPTARAFEIPYTQKREKGSRRSSHEITKWIYLTLRKLKHGYYSPSTNSQEQPTAKAG